MEQAAIVAKAMAEVSLRPGQPQSACTHPVGGWMPSDLVCALPANHVAGYPSPDPRAVSLAEKSGVWAPNSTVQRCDHALPKLVTRSFPGDARCADCVIFSSSWTAGRRWTDRGAVLQHGHGEFLKMVATKNMPEPLQRAKEGIDGVVGAVKGALPGVGDKDESDSQASVTDQVSFLLWGPLPFP